MGLPELGGETDDVVDCEPYNIVNPGPVTSCYITNHGVCLLIWLGSKNVPGFHDLGLHIHSTEIEE